MTMTKAEFIALARKQVGKPYVLGAEVRCSDPTPPRFDCSELVEWLYCRAGVKIRDLATNQYTDTTKFADPPTAGDLVFLRNNPSRPNGIGHVAVVTAKLANGDWEVVEARGRKYGVVRTTLSYWKHRSTYAGIRRYPTLALGASGPKPAEKPVSAEHPILRRGSTGARVTYLQQGLLRMFPAYAGPIHAPGEVIGTFGRGTEKVVKEFQRRVGIDDDGVVGPKTWAKLDRYGI